MKYLTYTSFLRFFLFFLSFSIMICCLACNQESTPDHCHNFIKDIDKGELGVDCGGPCSKCRGVKTDKEIFITHPNVVDSKEAQTGKLSFGHLIKNMASSRANQKELILSLFTSWEKPQTVNGFTVKARSPIRQRVLDLWKKRDRQVGVSDEDWSVNLSNAPFRLLGISNRIDLEAHDEHEGDVQSAGEGRFTFCLVDEKEAPLQFTLIFEYGLPASSKAECIAWAKKWHSLGDFSSFGKKYRKRLIEVTDGFVGKNKNPNRTNGSALNQVRTNELVIGSPWELREFNLVFPGRFAEVTRKQTPDISFINSEKLARFAQQNEAAILAETHIIPDTFENAPFLAGDCLTPTASFKWEIPAISEAVRAKLSLHTCNGCHGGETNTAFTHLKPREANTEAAMSDFLKEKIIERQQKLEVELLKIENRGAFIQLIKDERLISQRANQ